MKALADYVHKTGLKLGIYSSPGPNTCAGYECKGRSKDRREVGRHRSSGQARDLWLHQDVDASAPEYTATVPGHSVVMFRISGQ